MPEIVMYVGITPGGCISVIDQLKKEVNFYPMSGCQFRFLNVSQDGPESAILYFNEKEIARFPKDEQDPYYATTFLGSMDRKEIMNTVYNSNEFGQIKTF